jgi:competence protein ComEA
VALPDDGTSLTSEDIPAAVSSTSRSTKFKHPGDGAVDINTSTAVELQRLPGVGPATARKIIEYRAEHDGFKTIEELMEVKGIGPAKLRKMKPFVVLRERGE